MSGIAALIRFDGGEAEAGTLQAMTRAMEYRGPDGIVHRTLGRAAIAHCLLRTGGHEHGAARQPLMHEETGIALAMDGYLANREELRRDLAARGMRREKPSDAELALEAFLAWGGDCPARLEGEFACAAWDPRTRKLSCFRDHHGLRPLYYYIGTGFAVVASELAAVLAALPERPRVNRAYAAELLLDVSYSATDTVWQGIYRVPSAHMLEVCEGRISAREYWTLPQEVATPLRSDEEYIEAYRAMFSECVRQASPSTFPLACEVSGGLDSSGVFAMADRLAGDGLLAAPEVRGFSLAGPAGSHADEIAYARAVGSFLDVDIRERPLFQPELDWFARRAAQDRDAPPYPNAAMSLTLDEAAAAEGCRVMLTGVGGDQWLDGTEFSYHELLASGAWRQLERQLRADVSRRGLAHTLALFLRRGPVSFLPAGLRHGLRDVLARHRDHDINGMHLLRPHLRHDLLQRRERYEAGFPADYRLGYKLRKLRYPRWARILDQANRQRARMGLEMRSPMMSRRFIEFSATTPEHMRLRGGTGKYLHRRALSGLLPEQVLTRESKAEFSTTYFRHDRELAVFCTQTARNLIESLCEPAELDRLFGRYLHTPIDERYTGEIWGNYVVGLLLQLEVEFDRKGID